MKKLLALVLSLLLLFSAAAESTTAESVDALKAEIARLRAELETLQARLDLYRDPSVVAIFDGGFITFDEAYDEYQYLVELYAMFYGEDLNALTDEAREVQLDLLQQMVAEKLVNAHLEAEGVQLLTDEETAALRAQAAEAYEIHKSQEPEDDTTLEEFTEAYLNEAMSNAALEYVAGDVTVTDEDVRALYDEALENDREYYEANPQDYGFEALYGDSPITWIPEGYRRVRLLLVPFDDELSAKYDEYLIAEYDAIDDAAIAAAQQGKTDVLALLKPQAEAVRARLDAGETFEALLAEYNTGAEQMGETGEAQGFALSADSLYFSDTIEAAAMALKAPGDVSDAVPCDWGYVFIEYMNDIPSGPVAFENLRETFAQNARTDALYRQYDEKVAQWLEASNPEYFPDRMN